MGSEEGASPESEIDRSKETRTGPQESRRLGKGGQSTATRAQQSPGGWSRTRCDREDVGHARTGILGSHQQCRGHRGRGGFSRRAFEYYLDALASWDETIGHTQYLEPERTRRRGFVVIEDSPAEIARKLRETAAKDLERPWLRRWATGVEQNPGDFKMRARALINLPDGRILDPDGPLGCIRCEPGKWIFFGFQPLEDGGESDDESDVVSDDEDDVDNGS